MSAFSHAGIPFSDCCARFAEPPGVTIGEKGEDGRTEENNEEIKESGTPEGKGTGPAPATRSVDMSLAIHLVTIVANIVHKVMRSYVLGGTKRCGEVYWRVCPGVCVRSSGGRAAEATGIDRRLLDAVGHVRAIAYAVSPNVSACECRCPGP